MTDHPLTDQLLEDQATLRSLRNFVLGFAAFTLLLAVGVTVFAP
jgi:hypothetical protein